MLPMQASTVVCARTGRTSSPDSLFSRQQPLEGPLKHPDPRIERIRTTIRTYGDFGKQLGALHELGKLAESGHHAAADELKLIAMSNQNEL